MKQNQKWLSMLFAVVLLISSFLSPITTYAESTSGNDDDTEEIDNEKVDEEQKDEESAVNNEEEAEEVKNEESSKEDQDDSKEKKAASETKERAPPVTVDVRVETHEKTLVPTTEIEVESFELIEYINRNNGGNSQYPDSPRAIHAIIQALETVEGLDLKDDAQFGLGSSGNYIQNINGLGEFTHPLGMDGWMYFIDNSYVPVGVLDRELKGGESIVLYYVVNFTDNTFSWFDSEKYSVETGESLELELTGVNYDVVNPVKDASILIDEEEYILNDETILTDQNGNAEVVFNEPGTYHLSANRENDAGDRNIVRPYAEVVVTGDPVKDDEDKDRPEDVEVTEVESAISTLPAKSEITLKDVGVVEEARNLYEKLSEEQRNLVVNYNDLVNIEEKLQGLMDEIASVELAIDELPDVSNLTLDNKKSVEEVHQLFKDLTNEQQELVRNLDKLASLQEKLVELEKESKNEYDLGKHIDKTADYIISKGVNSEWEAIGLARAGKTVPNSYHDVFYNNVKNQVDDALVFGRAKITDIERLAISAVAIGKDPRDVKGTNLIEYLYDSPMRGATDSMTLQGNNGPIFALIALNSNDFSEPFESKWNREKLVDELLNNQNEDGSWSLNPSFANPSVDITAMAIIGLAPYKNQEKVKTAIEGAINYLSSVQNDEGGFTEAFVGGTSSEATAQTIIGLTAYGMDPTDKKFTKNGNNLIDHLLSFHNEDGGFAHTLDFPSSNAMATEQALQGLVAYDLFLNDEGRLYEFNNFNDNNDKNVEKVEEIIESLPTVKDFTLEQNDSIEEARIAYEKLTDYQKTLVNNYNKLEELEEKQKELEAELGIVNKTELENKIKEAKSINTSNKTAESVSNLNESITKAESVLKSDDAIKEDVEKALDSLIKAIDQLEDKSAEKVDKSTITEKVEEASKINIDNKTETSVEKFQTALSNANWVIASSDVSQKDVNKALKDLEQAIKNLEEITIDKSTLEKTLKQAKEASLKDRTESTKNVLLKSIEKGESTLANEKASQSDVDQAVDSIKKAINDLEYVEEVIVVESEKEAKVTAGKTVRVQGKEDSASIEMPKNLPENTSVIVKVIEDTEDEKERKVAGTVVDVQLILPDNVKDKEEFEYVLTLDVNQEFENEEVAIYHFNEDDNNWEYVGGEINEDGSISYTVTHFSQYGVFVVKDGDKPEEEKDDETGKDNEEGSDDETGKDNEEGSDDETGKDNEEGSDDETGKDNEEGSDDETGKDNEEGSDGETDKDNGEGSRDETDKKKEESILIDKVEEAQKYNKKNYTKKSLEKLNKALSNAETVLSDKNSTKEDISAAIKLINQAIDELVEETTEEKNQQKPQDKDLIVDVSDDSSNIEKAEEPENSLPKTATSYYTYMLIGSLLLAIAVMMLIIRKRRLN